VQHKHVQNARINNKIQTEQEHVLVRTTVAS